MAVKDRTKPIQAVVTKSPAKYLGPQTLLGLTRHLVQVSCEGVLITAWLTDEDFEKGFENVPEPCDKTYVNPLKAIRLRADAWTDRALERVDQVHCTVRCIRNGETWCDVKIMWKDGRTDVHPIKASDLYDAFENVPDESPVASVTVDGERLAGVKSVDIECDNGAAPETHEGNGKAHPEIDWKGEVECRPRSVTEDINEWRPFRVVYWCEEFPDQVYGHIHKQSAPYKLSLNHWEFRNKPKPDPKWESAGDDRPTLWQVWRQQGDECPQVLHTFGSARIAARYAAHWRTKQAMCGDIFEGDVRFAVIPCKAPVMPEAAEAGA